MGVYGRIALTGSSIPLDTQGYNRLLLQGSGSFRFSNNQADVEDSSSSNSFTESVADKQVILEGNLSKTIWIYGSGVSLYYALN